jgi:hypothetical protein
MQLGAEKGRDAFRSGHAELNWPPLGRDGKPEGQKRTTAPLILDEPGDGRVLRGRKLELEAVRQLSNFGGGSHEVPGERVVISPLIGGDCAHIAGEGNGHGEPLAPLTLQYQRRLPSY